MKENINDLIDDLLKNKISNDDHRQLEGMMGTDPAVARRVYESRKTFHFLQYARYQQIRAQLRAFDEKENINMNRSPYKRYVFASLSLMIMAGVCWILMFNYYNPENLAGRYFENVSGTELTEDDRFSSEIQNWDLANELFNKGNFQNAAGIFMVYTESREDPFYYTARWNVLMCQLAMDGPTQSWLNDLDRYKSLPFNPLKSQAIKLLRLLDSTFYKWIILNPSSHFSALKPRLI